MKNYKIILIILILFFSATHCLGSNYINEKILEIIVNDLSSNKIKITSLQDIDYNHKIIEDSNGVTTLVIDSSNHEIDKIAPSTIQGKIIIVDTFYFFSCNIINENYIVYNSLSKVNLSSSRSNTFIITGIATGRYNLLAVGIREIYSSIQKIFYFDIKGKSVELIKTTVGYIAGG